MEHLAFYHFPEMARMLRLGGINPDDVVELVWKEKLNETPSLTVLLQPFAQEVTIDLTAVPLPKGE